MKNNKIYVGILTALLSTTSVHASNSSFFKSGAYMGLAVGYSYLNAGIIDQILLPSTSTQNGSAAGVGLSHNIVGDIFVGYREFFKNGMFLGAELDLGRDNNKILKKIAVGKTFTDNSTSVKSNFKFVPSIVIGQQLNDRWLAYAKLGASIRGFKANHTAATADPTAAPDNQPFNKTKTGFMATVGTEYAFDKNISGTFDVSYERFQKINSSYNLYDEDTNGNPAVIDGTNNISSFKPTYVTVKLGVLYRF